MRRNRHLKEITRCAKGSTVKFNIDSLIETSGILANLRTLDIQGALFSDVARKKAMSEPGFPRLSNLIIKCSMESLTRDLSVLSTLSILSNCHITSLYIDTEPEIDEISEEDVAVASTLPQCADIFKHLCELRINSSVAANQWFQWIGPFCSNLQSFTLTTYAEFSPHVLYLIPAKVQTLNVQILSTFETDIDEIIGWLVCLQEVSSSRRFLKRGEMGDVEKSRGYTIHLLDALKRGIYVRILQQLLNTSSYSTSNKNCPFFELQRRTDIHLC